MLKMNVALSDGHGTINEDVVGHCDTAAWVIDGATGVDKPLVDTVSDAAWLARRADRALAQHITADPEMPIDRLMRAVIDDCRTAFIRQAGEEAAQAHNLPSAAFAMVRQIGAKIELVTLGDCRIIHSPADSDPVVFGETEHARFEAKTLQLVRDALTDDPDITASALGDYLRPQLRQNRRQMNRPNGYWVLGTEPEAAAHVDHHCLPARDGQQFAIASDGFLRLIEVFAIASPADLLAITTEESARAWLDRLRGVETAPRSRLRYPRVKIHDDASFLHCQI